MTITGQGKGNRSSTADKEEPRSSLEHAFPNNPIATAFTELKRQTDPTPASECVNEDAASLTETTQEVTTIISPIEAAHHKHDITTVTPDPRKDPSPTSPDFDASICQLKYDDVIVVSPNRPEVGTSRDSTNSFDGEEEKKMASCDLSTTAVPLQQHAKGDDYRVNDTVMESSQNQNVDIQRRNNIEETDFSARGPSPFWSSSEDGSHGNNLKESEGTQRSDSSVGSSLSAQSSRLGPGDINSERGVAADERSAHDGKPKGTAVEAGKGKLIFQKTLNNGVEPEGRRASSANSVSSETKEDEEEREGPVLSRGMSGSRTRNSVESKNDAAGFSSPSPLAESKPFARLARVKRPPGGELTESDDEHGDYNDEFNDEDSSPLPLGRGLSRTGSASTSPTWNSMLTHEDIEICQKLDEEYERALEEREVGWTARYNSVRQSACFSITFMITYLTLGTVFFRHQTDWELKDSLLFTIYTITTVGYGDHEIPTTPGFQTFTIFYIFVGIATLTILVAQVYQCIALEATKAQYSRDRAHLARQGNDVLEQQQSSSSTRVGGLEGNGNSETVPSDRERTLRYMMDFSSSNIDFRTRWEIGLDLTMHVFEIVKTFLRETQVGRGVSVTLPFAGLILIGAIVVGPVEGWTFIESIYFAVVSLTTVGFGDYTPTRSFSIWFCIFWLPFSVGFMSLYLGNVAHFYIRLSDKNIQRLEKQMRWRIKRAKEAAEKERELARLRAMRGQLTALEPGGDDDSEPKPPQDSSFPSTSVSASAASLGRLRARGFEPLQSGEEEENENESSSTSVGPALFGSPEAAESLGQKRRERILMNSVVSSGQALHDSSDSLRPRGETMTTMKAVLRAVHAKVTDDLFGSSDKGKKDSVSSVMLGESSLNGPEMQFMSIRSNSTMETGLSSRHKGYKRKPSFALRVLVQERMAEIIATDIAGFQSNVEIKENTLSVTIDTLKATADKWMVPRRARKAFRAVAFEALYFVGEHGLITRGADALYDLTPFEFHGLFSPLLAAMGDADTMEGWLASTKILADVDLRRDTTRPSLMMTQSIASRRLGDPSSGTPHQTKVRRSAKQAQLLEKAKQRHMSKAGDGAPSHNFTRSVAGNAFSNQSK